MTFKFPVSVHIINLYFTFDFRKSGQRAIEELQRTLIEVETRYKTEIARIKKKYETDIRELEAALDNANRANAEYLKQIKILQQRNKVTLFFSFDEVEIKGAWYVGR